MIVNIIDNKMKEVITEDGMVLRNKATGDCVYSIDAPLNYSLEDWEEVEKTDE